ncbi:hypothetical protein LCGC14_1806510 [marine sediment metagenome]|uniref:Uncharacterized protein n=1 Tax=marine sediment metagenome TaxID=412755 RepID=A0A0F9HAX3_9ZZZZ
MDGLKMKYFVLRPDKDDDHAFASRMAIRAYAANIRKVNPQLAKDLNGWVEEIEQALK